MDAIGDFEDLLRLLEHHGARYLIVGGLAFIYHAKPRYTKDMDLWVEPSADNLARVNRALEDFASPDLLEPGHPEQILQIGVAPNRIDLLQDLEGADFDAAWARRIRDRYGEVETNWVDLDTLLEIKRAIDHPRHKEDARVLEQVRRARQRRSEP